MSPYGVTLLVYLGGSSPCRHDLGKEGMQTSDHVDVSMPLVVTVGVRDGNGVVNQYLLCKEL